LEAETSYVSLVKTTKEYMDEMGATGAGIANEDEIQPGTALITKWGEL
jgi:hypothetical protein